VESALTVGTSTGHLLKTPFTPCYRGGIQGERIRLKAAAMGQ